MPVLVSRSFSAFCVTACLLGLGVHGCGDDAVSDEIPATEPSLNLISVTGAGAAGWQRGDASRCVELGRDPEQTLIVTVDIEGDWLLRPLHNCQSRTRCGFVEVEVSNQDGTILTTQSAASLTINVPVAGLSLASAETVSFAARLLNQDGEPYHQADGGSPCADDRCAISLSIAEHCSTPDPGLDGGIDLDAASTPEAGVLDDGSVPNLDGSMSDADPGPSDAAGDAALDATSVPDASLDDAGLSDAADADSG